MKKLIAWLAKGSKITKLLEKIYGALVVSYSTLDGLENGLGYVNKDIPEKMQKASGYLSLCIGALEKILGWFGIDKFERASIANQDMDIEKLSKEFDELLDEGGNDKTALTFE